MRILVFARNVTSSRYHLVKFVQFLSVADKESPMSFDEFLPPAAQRSSEMVLKC